MNDDRNRNEVPKCHAEIRIKPNALERALGLMWRIFKRFAYRRGFHILDFLRGLQKNRYGLVVVPRMATTDVQNVELVGTVGIKRPRATSCQGICTTMTVPK
jgi:hypothetical protein